ncbi:uncharacterized protein TNCV_1525601 [Trichonephila clavipes]|nr:uncharacterized protein TNCV_1525601 [Trichonephila clavipes]
MVFLNQVLTEFLYDIPLAAIQRLWFQHEREMGFWRISVLLYVIAYPGHWIGRQGPVLWAARSPDLTSLDFFPMGPSQRTGVSRHSDNKNGLSCLFACQRCGDILLSDKPPKERKECKSNFTLNNAS